MAPSSLVPLVDELKVRGLLRRERSPTDRRVKVLQLTEDAEPPLGVVRSVANIHEASLLAGLDPTEKATLTDLLRRIAREQGLSPEFHPGYSGPVAGPFEGAGSTKPTGPRDADNAVAVNGGDSQ